jgi:exodeoxyribonuclease VII small subunit
MTKKQKKDISLSQAFTELEKITSEFENEEIDLEKGIPKFKRGLELARFLKKRLGKIENEIEEIKDKFKDIDKQEPIEEPENTPF